MTAVLQAFGIDWHLLIVNAINFALLLAALWYFLYGPLTRILEERRQKIAQGVAEAEEAHKKLEEIEGARSSMLADAGKEAEAVLAHARENAAKKEHERVTAGEQAAARMVKEAEAQAAELKSRAIAESREEIAKLIVLGAEKALIKK
ncbi:MAG TPA: F0F1 ATP synthase subunit B [Candidatus Paceibacterota bacterium]|nr:F0F1 ATP synthase subunit B [Candidatus Paceibacterota bacterium]